MCWLWREREYRRHVYRQRTGRVVLQTIWKISSDRRKGSPDRRKQRGRQVRRTEKQSAHPVPWEQGNRLLVGAGLHNSGSDPVYRAVCAGPSALVLPLQDFRNGA